MCQLAAEVGIQCSASNTGGKTRLREMLRDLQITDEEYKSDLAKLETSYTDLQQVTKTIDWTKELTDILDLTSCVKEVLESGSFDAKRNILTRLGANLTWNDKNLFIDNKKSVNALINGIKTIKPILSEFGNEKALVGQGLSDENTQLCITLRKL